MALRHHPARTLSVQLTERGTAIVDDEHVELSALDAVIDHEGFVRRLWLMEPVMILTVEPSVSGQSQVETMSLAAQAGFKRIIMAAVEDDDAQDGVAAER